MTMHESTPTTIYSPMVNRKLLMDCDSFFLRMDHPVRWPTAKWLLSDRFGMLDVVATSYLDALIKHGLLKTSNGGWMRSKQVREV